MLTKRKLSITVDRDIYDAIDKAAKEYSKAKSQIAQEALELWLERQTKALMAKGYEEMQDEDKEFASLTLDAQREVLR